MLTVCLSFSSSVRSSVCQQDHSRRYGRIWMTFQLDYRTAQSDQRLRFTVHITTSGTVVSTTLWEICERLELQFIRFAHIIRMQIGKESSEVGRGVYPPNTLEQGPPSPSPLPSLPSLPLHSPSLRSRPPLLRLGGLGSALAPPVGPGGARPPNGIWWISG